MEKRHFQTWFGVSHRGNKGQPLAFDPPGRQSGDEIRFVIMGMENRNLLLLKLAAQPLD